MAKKQYIRTYYLIGPYDIVYGRFSKLREAKDHLLDMSRNNINLPALRPCIYKSCEHPASEYDCNSLKYIDSDQVWAYLYFSWDDYVADTLRQYKKNKFGYLLQGQE